MELHTQTIFYWVSHYGYPALFLLLLLGIVGLPMPDETLLAFAGYLVSRGVLRLAPTVAASFLGSVCGISLSYGLGRTLGSYLITKYGRWLHISTDRVDGAHRWFERFGRWTLAFGYFVPGVRHMTAFVAGMSKLELPVFAVFAYAGGFAWTLIFISAGYFLHEKWARGSALIHDKIAIGIGVIAVVALAYLLARRIHSMRK